MDMDATAALKSEIDQARRLCDLLESQREALLDRDLLRIEGITRTLEGEFERLAATVNTRVATLPDARGLGEGTMRLAREAQSVQARLAILLDLNQAIIGDRLAYVGTVLSYLQPGRRNASYQPGSRADGLARSAVLTRSA